MPNWCYNTIEFKTEEDAKRVWDAMASREDDSGEYFDFNKLIEMPACLDVTSGSLTTDAITLALTSGNPRFAHAREVFEAKAPASELRFARDSKRIEEGSYATDPKYRAEVEEAVDVYAENLEKYGSLSWYEWCCDNWGTKWNACESAVNGRFISFETAWSSPIPVLFKLIETFPGIWMDIYWYEEQGIEYVGEILSDGMGDVWFYEGANDKLAAAVYAKCNDGEDIRFWDGAVFTRECFEDDEEYYIEELDYPPFDEMSTMPVIEDVARSFGKRVGLPFTSDSAV